MSLVILNHRIADLIATEILTCLMARLNTALEYQAEGKDKHEEICEICNEITNISRQIRQEIKANEVKFDN